MRPGDLKYMFSALNRAGIRYVVIGGLAVVIHGVERATFDLDICLAMNKANIDKLWRTLSGLGYRTRQPLGVDDLTDPGRLAALIEEKNLKAVTFWNPEDQRALEVDVVIAPGLPFETVFNNRIEFSYQGEAIPVAAKSDLTAMKQMTGRARDVADVKALEEDD